MPLRQSYPDTSIFQLLEFRYGLLKPRHGIGDGAVIHAKSNAEVAGTVESATGYHQDAFFFQNIHEFDIIVDW